MRSSACGLKHNVTQAPLYVACITLNVAASSFRVHHKRAKIAFWLHGSVKCSVASIL